MSERVGSDIERLWNWIRTSTQNRLKIKSLKFRVVLCRIRLFPTMISKIKWLECELPLTRTSIISDLFTFEINVNSVSNYAQRVNRNYIHPAKSPSWLLLWLSIVLILKMMIWNMWHATMHRATTTSSTATATHSRNRILYKCSKIYKIGIFGSISLKFQRNGTVFESGTDWIADFSKIFPTEINSK